MPHGTTIAIPVFMKIAISHWQDRVSPVFDVANALLLVDMQGGRVLHRQSVTLSSSNPFMRAKEMVDAGATLLICGAISLGCEKALVQSGIRVIGFTCGAVEDVLVALQTGCFDDERFCMPGCNRPRTVSCGVTSETKENGK